MSDRSITISQAAKAARQFAQNVYRAGESTEIARSQVDGVSRAATETEGESSSLGRIAEALFERSRRHSAGMAGFLGELSDDMKDRRRVVRHNVDRKISVTVNGSRLVNIGSTGARLAPVSGISAGQHISSDLEGEAVTAAVASVDQENIGVQFDTLLQEFPFTLEQQEPVAIPRAP